MPPNSMHVEVTPWRPWQGPSKHARTRAHVAGPVVAGLIVPPSQSDMAQFCAGSAGPQQQRLCLIALPGHVM